MAMTARQALVLATLVALCSAQFPLPTLPKLPPGLENKLPNGFLNNLGGRFPNIISPSPSPSPFPNPNPIPNPDPRPNPYNPSSSSDPFDSIQPPKELKLDANGKVVYDQSKLKAVSSRKSSSASLSYRVSASPGGSNSASKLDAAISKGQSIVSSGSSRPSSSAYRIYTSGNSFSGRSNGARLSNGIVSLSSASQLKSLRASLNQQVEDYQGQQKQNVLNKPNSLRTLLGLNSDHPLSQFESSLGSYKSYRRKFYADLVSHVQGGRAIDSSDSPLKNSILDPALQSILNEYGEVQIENLYYKWESRSWFKTSSYNELIARRNGGFSSWPNYGFSRPARRLQLGGCGNSAFNSELYPSYDPSWPIYQFGFASVDPLPTGEIIYSAGVINFFLWGSIFWPLYWDNFVTLWGDVSGDAWDPNTCSISVNQCATNLPFNQNFDCYKFENNWFTYYSMELNKNTNPGWVNSVQIGVFSWVTSPVLF